MPRPLCELAGRVKRLVVHVEELECCVKVRLHAEESVGLAAGGGGPCQTCVKRTERDRSNLTRST